MNRLKKQKKTVSILDFSIFCPKSEPTDLPSLHNIQFFYEESEPEVKNAKFQELGSKN